MDDERESQQVEQEGRQSFRSGRVRIVGAEPADPTLSIPVVPAHDDDASGATDTAAGATDGSHGAHEDGPEAGGEPGTVAGATTGTGGATGTGAGTGGTELPHWTEAPTGEVPAILSSENGDRGAEDPWASLPKPSWREDGADWASDGGGFEPSMLAEGEPGIRSRHQQEEEERQPWTFELPGQAASSDSARSEGVGEDETVVERDLAEDYRRADDGLTATAQGLDDTHVGRRRRRAGPFGTSEPVGSEDEDTLVTSMESLDDDPFDPDAIDRGARAQPAGTHDEPGARHHAGDRSVAAGNTDVAADIDADGAADDSDTDGLGSIGPVARWRRGRRRALHRAPSTPSGPVGGRLDLGDERGARIDSGADPLPAANGTGAIPSAEPDADATSPAANWDVSSPAAASGPAAAGGGVAASGAASSTSDTGTDLSIGAQPDVPRARRPAVRLGDADAGVSAIPGDDPAVSGASGLLPPARRAVRRPVAKTPPGRPSTHRQRPLRPPAAASVTAGPEQGRNMTAAVLTGGALFALALVAFRFGTLPAVVVVTALVFLAAAEAYAAFRKAGYRPATLLGLLATISLMVATYNKGQAGLPLLLVLLFAFTVLWYLGGVQPGAPPVEGTAATLLVFCWVGVFGSFAALLLDPTLFPHRHGIAFLLGGIICGVACDIGALAFGSWLGRHPLAPSVSPSKTWEGAIGGAVCAVLAAVIVVHAIHPWTLSKALALGVVVAVVSPLGDLTESLVKRHLGLKDMGRMLPGHGGVLDRVDGLLFVLPATYFLVKAVHLG